MAGTRRRQPGYVPDETPGRIISKLPAVVGARLSILLLVRDTYQAGHK